MFLKAATVAASTLALLAPAPAALALDDHHTASAIDPATGKIPGYIYGETESNSYPGWLGSTPWLWTFSMQHIGYGPSPVAGVPFYLHTNTSIVSPDATGNVLMTIDQDAGGLPLRYAPTESMPIRCTRTQFDPDYPVVSVEIPCRSTIDVESGSFVVSKLEPLVPGFALDVEFPVVVDAPTSGTAAMTAMWATTDVNLSNNNVLATVPVTVAVNPNPPVTPTKTTKPLPKKLRKAKKVHSTTPKTCTVKKKRVVVKKQGVCKLVGKKNGHKVRVKIRY